MDVHDELNRIPMNRRQLLAAVGGALAAFGFAGMTGPARAFQTAGDGRAEVGLIFCDPRGMAGSRRSVVEVVVTRACPRIRFTVFTVRDAQQAREAIGRMPDVDGYLVWVFGKPGEAAQVFAHCSRPVVLAIDAIGELGRGI